MPATSLRDRINEVVVYFLRLGLLGFGGRVVGQMEKELVGDRGWLTKGQMREAIAICQSLPGPLAIQVGVYVSYLRAGFLGAWAGGWSFILPNFVIVAALGALYVYFGDLKPVTAIFYGVSPAVIALILHSCYRLAKLGMEDWLQWLIAAACLVVTLILQAEVALLFLGAGIVGISYYGSLFRRPPPRHLSLSAVPMLAQLMPAASGPTIGKLLLFFLKAGSLTFGSGLVIVPFLEQGLVQQYGWLDQRQFLIAVAIGMITPGPVAITATFVGYLVAGFRGSLTSTIGIFLSLIHSCISGRTDSGASSSRSKPPRFRKGRLCRGNRDNTRSLHPARTDRYRRLVDGCHRVGIARHSIPLESEQPAINSGDAAVGLIAFPLLQPTWVMVK